MLIKPVVLSYGGIAAPKRATLASRPSVVVWSRVVQAIMSAIDDYAERETGNREYFWNRPHKAG
jgi:hypothetical protein